MRREKTPRTEEGHAEPEQAGSLISTKIFERGAMAESVRYWPSSVSAVLVKKSNAGGPIHALNNPNVSCALF